MKLANVDGRATVVISDGVGVDVATASAGAFGPDLASVYDQWSDFTTWAQSAQLGEGSSFKRSQLGAPSPEPKQIFAFGLNYRAHALEGGYDAPEGLPPLFTKFRSALSGPDTTVKIPADSNTDWEVELVVVMGQTVHNIEPDQAWATVAGLTVGQDLSERITQLRPPAPQFSLGKSYTGFAPTGPWVVTPDEFANPDDLQVTSEIDGQQMQNSRTSDMLAPVPVLISELSKILTLYPGDIIFTGTPEGVGKGMTPNRFLKPGEHLRTYIEGIGELNQRFI